MNKQRLEYIDFAKGFAVLSIVIFHFCQPYVSGIWSKAIMIGGTGAHLFFVLSGFGLGLSAKVEAASFYKRRFIKILIPYYIVILTIYTINVIHPVYKDSGLYALCGHLFFYKMFDKNIITSFGYHFWFLSTIIQFYIIFPLIIVIKQKQSVFAFMTTSFAISTSYWLITTHFNLSDERMYNSFFLNYLWEFCAGIMLAKYYKDKNKLFWIQNNLLLISIATIGILTMALMAIKGGRIGQTFNDIPASIGYTSLSAFLFSISSQVITPLKKFLIFIGKLSYELYLTHMIIFLLLSDIVEIVTKNKSNIFISLLLILPITILCSQLIHKIFTVLLANTRANRVHRDRSDPHTGQPLPHHAAYGSVLRDSANPRQVQIQGNKRHSDEK